MEQVVLVDENDQVLGTMEKLEAHRKGLLHRAFSILVFNSRGELLIQRRADHKYHSAGLWSNTCCSHPRPDESIESAAHRRLLEEMGFDCSLTKAFQFIYKAKLTPELYEHELDHVLIGIYDGSPFFNKEEVSDYKFVSVEELTSSLKKHPERYTFWFKEIIEKYLELKGKNF